MIGWRQYRAGDIALIKHEEPDPVEGWQEAVEASGIGLVTITLSGDPVAVIGGFEVCRGVADCFACVDRRRASGHGRTIAKMARVAIDQSMIQYQLHRVQATAQANDRQALVWLRALGFKVESVMRKAASDGSDMIMTTRLRGEEHE